MAQLSVRRPLDEPDLDDDLRPNPVSSNARQALPTGERCRGDFKRVQAFAQIPQQLRIEPGSNFAREQQVVTPEMTDEQCAETNSRALRIGETAHDEFLCGLTLHL